MEIRLPPKIAQTALVAAIITLQGAVAGAQAQQSWLLTGNPRTNPAQDFLGTRDNQPLAIRTNGAERLRVDASGNVGVGTLNPTVKLDVAQNSVASHDFWVLFVRNWGNEGKCGAGIKNSSTSRTIGIRSACRGNRAQRRSMSHPPFSHIILRTLVHQKKTA